MTKEEIAAVLQEVQSEFAKAETEAVAALRKADEGSEPKPEPKESESASGAPGGEDSSSPALDPTGDPAADASSGAPAGGPPAGPAAGAPPADPAAQQPGLTPEALQAEYAQLPPEELDMHIQAALAAKEALAATAAPAAGPAAGAPPAGPAAGAPPPSAPPAGPPDPMAMGKEELRINKEANGGKITEGVKKSEDLIAQLAALVKSQQEDIENLSKAVKIVLETPVRKSVLSFSEVATEMKKSEPTAPKSRKDVDDFIKSNAHRMTKSERDLWLDYVNNKVPATKLAPMLDRLTSAK